MNNIMQYKGYIGSVEFSEENEVFYGKVLGIRSLISYEGTTAKELIADFTVPLTITLLYAKKTTQNRKKHIKAVLMCVSLRSFTKKP